MPGRILCFLIGAALALSQDGPTSQPRTGFDVVSVKPVPPDSDHLLDSYCEGGGGRFALHGTPLLSAIVWAYGVNQDRIGGWPSWLNSFRTYDIDAVVQGSVTQDGCKKMAQTLFEERFKLRMHKQTRTVPVFALVLAKNGPKFTAGTEVTINGRTRQVTTEQGEPVGATMARLANYIGSIRAVQRPVIDRTMLTGAYGFTLNYSVDDRDDRPEIFTALPEQLGLRLQPTKAPIEMWVVDHVERRAQIEEPSPHLNTTSSLNNCDRRWCCGKF